MKKQNPAAGQNVSGKKEKRFFGKVKGFKRFLLFGGIYFVLFLIVLSAAAEYTSKPSFCPTCHYMETFYQSWRTSGHSKVDCVECHFEPGISGTIRGKLNGLVQIVNYVSLAYKKRTPWAEIPDNTCARSGCHENQALEDTTYYFKGVEFSHKNHLKELKRGKTLKCTSCHSQIVQGTHIEVTTSTCFNCHFKKSDDPEHQYDKLTECTTCHNWKDKSKIEMASFRYDHTLVTKNNLSCLSCHTNTVSGNGEVGKERCFQCHFETDRLDKYNDTKFIHDKHIKDHSMKCFNCHNAIEHKVQKIDPTLPADCMSCHSDSHTSQVNLFTGEGGHEVEKTPSVMFLNGINCKGCHIFHETDKKDIKTFKASGSSCEKCHGKGYDKLVKEWEVIATKRLSQIKTIYNAVNTQVINSKNPDKTEAEKMLKEAYHNMRLVEVGKSVHNIQFADKLLVGSYNLLKKALTSVGSSAGLPDFRSSADVIPNECYKCHLGIQEISVKKFGMNFSHDQHIVDNKIACDRCHSNVNKHGELIVTKQSCNNCHHSQQSKNDACVKCHSFQVRVYDGNYLNKNQPDFMKAAGSGCIDCHLSSDRIIKPDNKICIKCHENGYDVMMDEWKTDVRKLQAEINELLEVTGKKELTVEDENEIREIRRVVSEIQNYPSIYVHNYDLISTTLNEKIKILKKME